MGQARDNRGAMRDGRTQARRSIQFRWGVFRLLAVVGAALSVLALKSSGEAFWWNPLVRSDPFAMSISSDEMPQQVLDECDDRANAFGAYDRIIQAATNDLVAIGVFADDEFRGVKVGFCELHRFRGPVATTSCAHDAILLDDKHMSRDQRLLLRANLGHEMKHYFQHQEQKGRLGESYCYGDQYTADKIWMEAEADRFGDEVAALFFVGRPIEIYNSCAVSISVYLEGDALISDNRTQHDFFEVPPRSTVKAPAASMSKFIWFYAESDFYDGQRWVWSDPSRAQKRLIDGKAFGLKRYRLSNLSRTTGPFLMSLSCS